MYVKDSIIEARIEKDLKKQHIKGRIEEVEHLLGFRGLKANAGVQGLKKDWRN